MSANRFLKVVIPAWFYCTRLDCSQSPIFPCDRRCRYGSLDASETGESKKCPWVGVVEGTAGGKIPHAINPTTLTQGHFVLSPVSLASRDQDDGPVELNDRHLRPHGKIGDCEHSGTLQTPRKKGMATSFQNSPFNHLLKFYPLYIITISLKFVYI